MSKRNALRRVLTEASGFDLARKAVDLQNKAAQELTKKLKGLGDDAAKMLKRAGAQVTSVEAKLDHKGRPKFWFILSDARDGSEVLRVVQQTLGASVKIMPGYKSGEWTVVL